MTAKYESKAWIARLEPEPLPPGVGADDWHGISLSHMPKARVGMGTVGYPLHIYMLQVVLFGACRADPPQFTDALLAWGVDTGPASWVSQRPGKLPAILEVRHGSERGIGTFWGPYKGGKKLSWGLWHRLPLQS